MKVDLDGKSMIFLLRWNSKKKKKVLGVIPFKKHLNCLDEILSLRGTARQRQCLFRRDAQKEDFKAYVLKTKKIYSVDDPLFVMF